LDELQRLEVAIDWAKACKDSGQAGKRHQEIIYVYDSGLSLVENLLNYKPNDSMLLDLKARILNNRATQVAVFGDEAAWCEVESNVSAAFKIYAELKDNEGMILSRLNFIALSLDRDTTQKTLNELWKSVEKLDIIVRDINDKQIIFFYLYQRARLIKHMKSNEPDKGVRAYERAEQFASCGLQDRAAIAKRWILKLSYEAHSITEEEYIRGIKKCTIELRNAYRDAWTVGSLRECLIELAKIYTLRKESTKAWEALVEAFEIEAQRHTSSEHKHLKAIISFMISLSVDENTREDFLNSNIKLINTILDLAKWDRPNWNIIKERVAKNKE